MSEIIKVIDEALERSGLSDTAASKLAADNASVIKNLRLQRGSEKRYNYATLEKLAEVLNLEIYFGPPRELKATPAKIIEGWEFAAIPLKDVNASAGPGATNDEEQTIGTLAFRRDWLKRNGIAASNAMLIRVRGDSMLPIIQDNDMVMIDRSRRTINVRARASDGRRRSDIYAINQGSDTRIKWIERPDEETLIIYSENAGQYVPEFFQGEQLTELDVVGKVVWWGHTVNQ